MTKKKSLLTDEQAFAQSRALVARAKANWRKERAAAKRSLANLTGAISKGSDGAPGSDLLKGCLRSLAGSGHSVNLRAITNELGVEDGQLVINVMQAAVDCSLEAEDFENALRVVRAKR